MAEHKFYDLSLLVSETDELSASPTQNKWQVIDYEAADFQGKLLFADVDSSPKSLTLDPRVKGKYHVYLGLINPKGDGFGGTSTGFGILSDGAKTQIFAVRPDVCWKSHEWFEESYYGVFDLTDEKFVLSKPCLLGINSALAWIRLVSADEVEKTNVNPCMAYHFDLDYFDEDRYNNIEESLGRIRMISDGSPELILHERFPLCNLSFEKEHRAGSEEIKWGKYYFDHLEEVDRAIISEAHSMGAKIYASYRIQAGGFGFFADHLNGTFEDKWFSEHPEFRCKTRDGRTVNTSSFAYPEVRRRIVEMIKNGSDGFDGVCVFFHRGTFVAFEEPVRRMVYEKYGVDATRLPMSDPRLNEVMCHFINLFMRELRAALGDKKDINAIVFYGVTDSKSFGYDVKTWVDEGLVSSISQGLMTHFEELDGILDCDGLIDMEKYKKALTERPVVCRSFAADYERVTKGAMELKEVCGDKAELYATLGWERTDVNNVIAIIDELKSVGIKKFISWNTNHKAKVLRRLNLEKYYAAGCAELYEKRKTRYIRTMSIAGYDISTYNTDWKG